jgi:hypothetical protein
MPVTPITVQEAARRTGRKPWDIYRRPESGRLPFAKLNGVRFVAWEDVLALPVLRIRKAAS